MAVQDKFAVGPVMLVQLIGLDAKPRMPSARADGAARAADTPLSAAAGFGGKHQQPAPDAVPSYFALKATTSLGVTADPLRAHATFDQGIDHPVPGGTATSTPVSPASAPGLHQVPAEPDAPDIPALPAPLAPVGNDVRSVTGGPEASDAETRTPTEAVSPTISADEAVATGREAAPANTNSSEKGADVASDGHITLAFSDDEMLDFSLAGKSARSAGDESFAGDGGHISAPDFDVVVHLLVHGAEDVGLLDPVGSTSGQYVHQDAPMGDFAPSPHLPAGSDITLFI